MEWQPIETAPKDGLFLAMWSEDEFPIEDGDEDGAWRFAYVLCENGIFYSTETHASFVSPTHWMPLPPPPKATE